MHSYSVTYIILLIGIGMAKSEFQFQGLYYLLNQPNGNQAIIALPEQVENDPRVLNKVVKWSIKPNQKLACAVTGEDSFMINKLKLDSTVLFNTDRTPCQSKYKVSPGLFNLQKTCGKSYKSYLIGFQIYDVKDVTAVLDKKGFFQEITHTMVNSIIPIIRVCIHEKTNRMLVTSFLSKLAEPKRPDVDLSKVTNTSLDELPSLKPFYSEENQFAHFHDIMKPEIADELEKNDFFLTPRQFVRTELMILDNLKPATYYDFNYVPIWNNISDDWAEIENEVIANFNQFDTTTSTSFRFMSGTHQSYLIKNEISQLTLYLMSGEEQLEVPYYHWNLYYSGEKEKFKGFFVVLHNDYYPNRDNPQQERLCDGDESKCGNFSALEKFIKNKKNILAYCCLATKNSKIVETLELENFFTDENFIKVNID